MFEPFVDGDPKWSDRASAFYGTLGRWVADGEIRVTGEDGVEWAYMYRSGEVTQVGVNGYDGSTTAVVIDSTDAVPTSTSRVDDPVGVASDERPARLRSNRATLCCANPRPALFGHPAPWTATMSTSLRLPPPADAHGLSYAVSVLEPNDRSARELDDLVAMLQAGEGTDELAEIVRRARLTQMVVGIATASPSFSPEQLDRILQLQIDLDALLIHEEVATYRTSGGTHLSVAIRY